MANPNIKDFGFGTAGRSKKFDNEVRQKGLEARKGKPRIWTKEKCIEELEDILKCLKRILREEEKVFLDKPDKLKRESIRDLNTMMNRILDFMKYLYPPVQQNVNLNIDMTAEKVIDRIKNYKKEEVVVFGDKEK